MAQNIYDNQPFFDQYALLPRSQNGLTAAPEWPSIQTMLGTIHSKRVLDLGCGYGWFCRWARQNGATTVHGVDVSQNMIDKALSSDPQGITYEVADLETYTLLSLEDGPWDIVHSSLAFHYLGNLEGVFRQVYENMREGGRFVFSVEHPIFTAPVRQVWETGPAGEAVWPLNGYAREGQREYEWLGSAVKKYHRTTATYVKMLLRTGFTLVDLEDWEPSDEDLKKHPDWVKVRERPMFMLVAARK